MALTKTQRALVDQALTEVREGRWATVDGKTILWTRRVPTPHYARRTGNRGAPLWPEDTYPQRVFLTFLFGSRHRTVLMRVDRAPWVEAQDRKVTLMAAMNVLRNPALELDR